MDTLDFKNFANSMIDYIVDYRENIRNRKVLGDVKYGYLRPLLPQTAPKIPDTWQNIMTDIERVIMPGVTHWQSPHFHACFPISSSYPSIVADMLDNSIGCSAFSWKANPACTELEIIVLNWLGKMMDLPTDFLASSSGKGGGVIQGSASETTLVALLAAKAKKIDEVKKLHPDWSDHVISSKLIGYTSSLAHSSVGRAGLLSGIKITAIDVDENNALRGKDLETAIQRDLTNNRIPFFVVTTLGTTATCSFDRLDECGPIADKYKLWIHVDAAYAGSAFICPEYRYLMKGIEYTQSFNFDPHKWMLVNFDCSVLWFKDASWFINAYNVDATYLEDKNNTNEDVVDFRHWQIPLSRRFRSLKLWFVLRLYGIEKLQQLIRNHCKLAQQFADLCRSDERFEIVADVYMGLVCFRLKGSNSKNEELLTRINERGNIFMVPSTVRDVYFLRMAICSPATNLQDLEYAWHEICTMVGHL